MWKLKILYDLILNYCLEWEIVKQMINSGIENYFGGFKTKLEKQKAWHVVYVFVILQLTNGDVCLLITFGFQPIEGEEN